MHHDRLPYLGLPDAGRARPGGTNGHGQAEGQRAAEHSDNEFLFRDHSMRPGHGYLVYSASNTVGIPNAAELDLGGFIPAVINANAPMMSSGSQRSARFAAAESVNPAQDTPIR